MARAAGLKLMARAAGIKYFYKLSKHDLAEKLGIQLPGKRRVYSRKVEIINLDETTTLYPSMTQAAKAIGTNPMQIYILVAKGNARFV